MRHATGNKALAIDDRTGQQVKYKDLRTEWNGLRVHKSEWEAKHPQLTRKPIEDAVALVDPRPGSHSREDANVLMRHGLTLVTGINFTYLNNIGETPDGVESITAVGTVAIHADAILAETGLQITSAIGNENAEAIVPEGGQAIVTAVGTVTAVVADGWGNEPWGTGGWGE